MLQNLEYTTDLMAGQESHVYKFADRPALYYNCQVELKIRDEVTGCAALVINIQGVNKKLKISATAMCK